MKVLFGSYLDYLVTVLFGIGCPLGVALTPRCLECCLIWNDLAYGSRMVAVPQWHLQILSPNGENLM